MRQTAKRTPLDTTEFEREQLRFFLKKNDVAAVLAEVNPSLAWLPMLSELGLVDSGTQLATWLQKNFADANAIREVAANIRFFGPDTAEILESRLDQTEGLPSLMVKCWRLIIRHMRNAKRGLLRDDWFAIAPRIKRGEQSSDLLERLVRLLSPKLRIGRRFFWHGENDEREPKQPIDLISIDYEIEEHITDDEVLSTWPATSPAEVDDKLLKLITHALIAAIEDAVEADVESDFAYSLSDTDVPSVAKHEQNAHRKGFLPIVRVAADLWTRLARKDGQRALKYVEIWRENSHRLIRRLAVFSAADPVVPADKAARVLMTLPAGELFLTGSSVEVYRLVDARWHDFAPQERLAIEERIMEGPPANWFQKDSAKHIDSRRFDLLGYIERNGGRLSVGAQTVLDGIRKQWPHWTLRPKEQAGFHVWHGSPSGFVGDPDKLSGIPDNQLILAAKKFADKEDFHKGNAWPALCQIDTPRALRGLEAQAAANEWPAWAWSPFLWNTPKTQDLKIVTRIAQLLREWPEDSFSQIAADASWWLNEANNSLHEHLLWPLWDRIADASIQEAVETNDNDALTTAINHPSGRLAEILINKLPKRQDDGEFPEPFRMRLDKLITAPGNFGRLARVCLARQVAFLFERAPRWTNETMVPLFDWSKPDAAAVWSARKYANYVGSPELFGMTKQPFLELFGRTDIPVEDLRTFADWLTAIMLANEATQSGYPITSVEARSALRKAGVKCLSSVGHRLAREMESAKADEKFAKWHEVVGPVFQSIWPLDVELQTSASTFKLVQILLASGAAFQEAADAIIPFIRSEDAQHHTSLYSVSRADEALYLTSPEKMLDLVAALTEETAARGQFGLRETLDRIRQHAPQLANTRKFQKILSLVSIS